MTKVYLSSDFKELYDLHADEVRSYIQLHPGCSPNDIALALALDLDDVKQILNQLEIKGETVLAGKDW